MIIIIINHVQDVYDDIARNDPQFFFYIEYDQKYTQFPCALID